LKARDSKLDLWDIVALNAWLELPYYDKWYNGRTTGHDPGNRTGRAVQRVRGYRSYTRDGRFVIAPQYLERVTLRCARWNTRFRDRPRQGYIAS
jgi:hypothetical protein